VRLHEPQANLFEESADLVVRCLLRPARPARIAQARVGPVVFRKSAGKRTGDIRLVSGMNQPFEAPLCEKDERQQLARLRSDVEQPSAPPRLVRVGHKTTGPHTGARSIRHHRRTSLADPLPPLGSEQPEGSRPKLKRLLTGKCAGLRAERLQSKLREQCLERIGNEAVSL
jgi:hypothetical protein